MRSSPKQHRLIIALIQPLDLREAGVRQQAEQSIRADCIIAASEDVRPGGFALVVILDEVHRQVIKVTGEVPDLKDDVARFTGCSDSVRLDDARAPLLL